MSDLGSPGVIYNEEERVVRQSRTTQPVVAIIGGATRGPTEVTEVRNVTQLKSIFGDSVDTDYGLLAASYNLRPELGALVLYRRVLGSKKSMGTNKPYVFSYNDDSNKEIWNSARDSGMYRFKIRNYSSNSPFRYGVVEVQNKESTNDSPYYSIVVYDSYGTVKEEYTDVSNDLVEELSQSSIIPVEVGSDRLEDGVYRIYDTLDDTNNGVVFDALGQGTVYNSDGSVSKYNRSVPLRDGDESDEPVSNRFVFLARNYNSYLNEKIVTLAYQDTSRTKIKYTLSDKKGNVIESYQNITLEQGSRMYLPDFLERMESLVTVQDLGEGNIETVIEITGVDDGIKSISTDDYKLAIDDFSNPELVDFGMIIIPGVTDIKVQEYCQKMVDIRKDTEYIPDMPFGTTPKTAKAFFDNNPDRTNYKIDDPFISVGGPWWKVKDISTGEDVWMPPSAIISAITAHSDTLTNASWYAAAGFGDQGRGLVPSAVEGEYLLTKSQRDDWVGGLNVLNPICYRRGSGTALFGDRTTKRTVDYETPSLFCDRHIRRMCNYVKRMVTEKSFTIIFEPDDPTSWAKWVTTITPILQTVKDGRGIVDFRVIMDSTTVSDEDIRNRRAPGYIYIWPTRAIEHVVINTIVTEDSVFFTESEG